MNEQDPALSRRLHGDPNGDPLAVVLYRLQQIEHRMDRLLTAELYTARHEALQARVAELLAMIDRPAPATAEHSDYLDAYLRETAPEVIADLYRPAPAATEHFDHLDAVPEAAVTAGLALT